jgi:hypothetical protein
MSKASLLDNDAPAVWKGRKRGEDVMSRVFNIIRIMRPFRGRRGAASALRGDGVTKGVHGAAA